MLVRRRRCNRWRFPNSMIDPENHSYILIPGAGGMAWYWHRVVALLEQARREVIAVELPGDYESAGLDDYAGIVVREIGQRTNVTLVAQSLGAFTAAVVCELISVGKLIFVNAMNYGTEFDLQTYFLRDLPEGVLRSGPAHQRDEAEIIFRQPCNFRRWPQIPMRVIASADDRFFPLEFQRRIARSRLKTDVHVIRGGHLVALSNPEGLVEQFVGYEHEWD